jgi:hypothetical protein
MSKFNVTGRRQDHRPALSIFAPLSPKGVRRPRVVLTTEEWVVCAPGSW